MLQLQSIDLELNRRHILRNVSASFTSGTVTVVLGPNGAGKSSLLRVASGEWQATAGSVTLDGKALAHFSPRELGQRRAFLHQESSLEFAFTVEEVVLLGRSPHISGGERPQDLDAVREALRRVDMLDRATDWYTRLSGGEKQRVQLARVLAQLDAPEPHGQLLFLDEPTNNLDPAHRKLILQIVRDAAAKGIAVILVIHDLNDALQAADRVLLLKDGRVAFDGTPAQVVHGPLLDDVFDVRFERIPHPQRPLPILIRE